MQFATGAFPLWTTVGDFNGDGFTDVAVANQVSANATVGFVHPTAAVTATASNVPVPVGNPAKTAHQLVGAYSSHGQFASSTSDAVPVTPQKLKTSLTLVPSKQSIHVTDQLVLTATLTPTSGQDHTTDKQNVTFFNGSQQIGTVQLSGGVAAYHTKSGDIHQGTNNYQATFAGDDNFTSATSNIAPVTGTTTLQEPASGIRPRAEVQPQGAAGLIPRTPAKGRKPAKTKRPKPPAGRPQ